MTPHRPSHAMAPKIFGELDLKKGLWPNASTWCRAIDIPETIASQWINTGTKAPTRRIYVHNWMAEPLLKALQAVRDRGLLSELKTFDGCFNVRDKRGFAGRFSWHSYALAIDLNADENRLGLLPRLSKSFVECFTEQGFVWGGEFHRPDGMHFQWAID